MTSPETPRRPPRRPLTGWVLLLPILLGGGVVLGYLLKPSPSPQPPVASNATTLNEASLLSTPGPAATHHPTPPALQFSTTDSVYLPDGDKLRKKRLPHSVIREQQHLHGDQTPVLNAIIRMAPQFYPKGARVLSWHDNEDNSAFVVDVNRAFADDAFWSQNGEQTTELAIYALVNSVTDEYAGKGPSSVPVKFTVEGKPIATLGEFDATDAFKPDMSLVAKS